MTTIGEVKVEDFIVLQLFITMIGVCGAIGLYQFKMWLDKEDKEGDIS